MKRLLLLVMAGVCLAAAGVALAAGVADKRPPLAPAQIVTLGGGTLPTDPNRLAVDNSIEAAEFTIMGYRISCYANSGETPGSFYDWFVKPPYNPGLQQLAYDQTNGFDLEQLGSCHPN